MIASKKKGDDEKFNILSKLHKRLYDANTEGEVIKIKQEFHMLVS